MFWFMASPYFFGVTSVGCHKVSTWQHPQERLVAVVETLDRFQDGFLVASRQWISGTSMDVHGFAQIFVDHSFVHFQAFSKMYVDLNRFSLISIVFDGFTLIWCHKVLGLCSTLRNDLLPL